MGSVDQDTNMNTRKESLFCRTLKAAVALGAWGWPTFPGRGLWPAPFFRGGVV